MTKMPVMRGSAAAQRSAVHREGSDIGGGERLTPAGMVSGSAPARSMVRMEPCRCPPAALALGVWISWWFSAGGFLLVVFCPPGDVRAPHLNMAR